MKTFTCYYYWKGRDCTPVYLLEQIWWRMGEDACKPRSPVFICEHGRFFLRILWSPNGKLVLRGPVVWDSRGATMPFISGSFRNPNYQTPNHQPSTIIWYCWWKKSCTTWDELNPVNSVISTTISTGAGVLPSTVWGVADRNFLDDVIDQGSCGSCYMATGLGIDCCLFFWGDELTF